MLSRKNFISRIAPTPSGFLHAGNAFSFVLTWLLVRKSGGKLLLRIDDIDAVRKRPEYVEDIFRTIEWLGLDYDLGPQGPDDFEKNFSQKHRLDLYFSVLAELEKTGGLMYPCNCSRKDIQQQSQNGLYPGTCRHKTTATPAKNCALRVWVPEGMVTGWKELLSRLEIRIPTGAQMGDFVVKRKDGLPAYQLVSLADDMEYEVDLLVRGTDLQDSTSAQLFLAGCLSGQREGPYSNAAAKFCNAAFVHHPLMLNSAGEKLSKSAGAFAVSEIRKAGKGPERILEEVALFLGLPPDSSSDVQALLKAFTNQK